MDIKNIVDIPYFERVDLKWCLYFAGIIPLWFRFMQCFRRFYDTKLMANIQNAGKYLTAISV